MTALAATSCFEKAFFVGGTVEKLVGTGLVIANQAGDAAGGVEELSIAPSQQSFAFVAPVTEGATYEVTVRTQPSNPAQVCSVSARGRGTMGKQDVNDIVVSCTGTLTISGTITGPARAGVRVTLSGADTATTTTDASGAYRFAGLLDGSYTVTPSLGGYAFAPASQSIALSGASVGGQDFVALEQALALALSATSVTFSGREGGSNPAAQTVTVTNGGGGTLAPPTTSIAYGTGSGWLAASVAGVAAPYAVTLQPSLAGLAAGTYVATVAIASASASNSPQTVGVTLTVGSRVSPTIALSSVNLSFSGTEGAPNPPAQTVTVTNSGTGALAPPTTSISYDTGGGWLEASVAGAAAPYAITVQPHLTGLAAGTYAATIAVASAGASNTPQTVRVTLTVNDYRAVINSFTASPMTVASEGSTTLSWNVTGATSLSIDNGIGAVTGSSGSRAVSPGGPGSVTFVLTATNAYGTRTASARVGVDPLTVNVARTTLTGSYEDNVVPDQRVLYCTGNVTLVNAGPEALTVTQVTYRFGGACGNTVSYGASYAIPGDSRVAPSGWNGRDAYCPASSGFTYTMEYTYTAPSNRTPLTVSGPTITCSPP